MKIGRVISLLLSVAALRGLFEFDVDGAPVVVEEASTPLTANDSNDTPLSPVIISNAGNLSFGANLPGIGPLEIQLNMFDLSLNDEFVGNDDDEEDIPCSSSEEDFSSSEDITDLRDLLGLPGGTETEVNEPSGSSTEKKDSATFSLAEMTEMANMYADMAYCTRSIQYTAISGAKDEDNGKSSSTSLTTLQYFSQLCKCLILKNAYEKVKQASGIDLAPPPAWKLSSDDELQADIKAKLYAPFTEKSIESPMRMGPSPAGSWLFQQDLEASDDEPTEESLDFIDENSEHGDADIMGVILLSVIVVFFVCVSAVGLCYGKVFGGIDEEAQYTQPPPRQHQHQKKPIWLVLKDSKLGGGEGKNHGGDTIGLI